jgi:hypothetical protein
MGGTLPSINMWTKQPSNGGGRDAKWRLFVLYSEYIQFTEQLTGL